MKSTTTTSTTTTTTSSDTKSCNLNQVTKSLSDIKTSTNKPSSTSINSSTFTSNYNSPALSSVPSSAFASALQSPYISPRATQPEPESKPQTRPASSSSSHRTSDIFPSNLCTPPPERSDFSTTDQEERVLRVSEQPRISFSFLVIPRVSFARGSSVSASSVNTKLRSCDVFFGCHGQTSGRLARWLKTEIELQGIACFVADRARYADSQSHEIADRVISSEPRNCRFAELGRKSVAEENIQNDLEYSSIEFPFPRNPNFVEKTRRFKR